MTVIVTKDAINLREKLSELDKETGIKGEEIMRADTSAEAREALQLDQQLFTDFESTGIDDNATSTQLTVSDSGIDVTGTVIATNYTDAVYALSGTALDPANGGIQTKTLAANTTFTDSLASGESLVLQLEAGASYTVTWPTMKWVTSSGNVAPTLTAKDTLVFWKVSSTLYGAYTGSYV